MHIFFHRQTNFRQTFGAIFGGEKEKKKGKKKEKEKSTEEIRRETKIRVRRNVIVAIDSKLGDFRESFRAWSCQT